MTPQQALSQYHGCETYKEVYNEGQKRLARAYADPWVRFIYPSGWFTAAHREGFGIMH